LVRVKWPVRVKTKAIGTGGEKNKKQRSKGSFNHHGAGENTERRRERNTSRRGESRLVGVSKKKMGQKKVGVKKVLLWTRGKVFVRVVSVGEGKGVIGSLDQRDRKGLKDRAGRSHRGGVQKKDRN